MGLDSRKYVLASNTKDANKIQKLREELLSRKYLLASHRDSDGITSAVLLNKIGILNGVFFPETFGDYISSNGKKATLMTDMIPIDSNIDIIVIDHHPDHPENHKYKLIFDAVPASLIVWRLVKHRLKPEDYWKVVVGLAGDGQPELTPIEIWEKYPILVEEWGSISESYGRIWHNAYPIYQLLSSYINAPCRMGLPAIAFKALNDADTPLDILMNKELKSAKEEIKKEVSRVIKEYPAITIKSITLWIIESDYSIGFLASRLESSRGKTTIVYNKKNKTFSVRGSLATYIKHYFNKHGIKAGGHAGFVGGNLNEEQDEHDLINVIRKIAL